MAKKRKLATDDSNLVQLESIVVDRNTSREERLESYLEQIDNPYRFKHKKIKVKLTYSNSGKSLEDCILHLARGL